MDKYDKNSTLPYNLRPLMECQSVRTERCAICGRKFPLNQHHIVRRGAGRLYLDGEEIEKPTITLCGFGNTLKGPDGNFCHGMVHHHMLHFRNGGDGVLQYVFTPVPMKYDVVEMFEDDVWEDVCS